MSKKGAGPRLFLSRILFRRPCRDAKNPFWSVLVAALGLRHRLISVAPPGREIASLSSPTVSSLPSLTIYWEDFSRAQLTGRFFALAIGVLRGAESAGAFTASSAFSAAGSLGPAPRADKQHGLIMYRLPKTSACFMPM